MARVIAVSNVKGGTTKTTSTISIGAELAARGVRTLIIDLDQQGNVATLLGLDKRAFEYTIADVLRNDPTEPDDRVELTDVVETVRDHLDLALANFGLKKVGEELATRWRREDRLKEELAPYLDRWDIILLDCPPSIDLMTTMALAAADEVLIPMTTEYLSLVQTSDMLQAVERVQVGLNPKLAILGILPARLERNSHTVGILETLNTRLGDALFIFDGIPQAVAVKNASDAGKPIREFDPKHPVTAAYARAVDAILAYPNPAPAATALEA